MKLWLAATALATAAGGVCCSGDRERAESYRSPYSVAFTHPAADLTADLDRGPRGDMREAAVVPHREWYSHAVRERFGAWGPMPKHYPAALHVVGKSDEWRRERVVAVALRFRGYAYQHHHLPDWDPPAGWPWKETQAGRNGKGVDCSNFTSFVYNLGFGVKPSSAVAEQAEQVEIRGPGDRPVRAERIEKPSTYAKLVETLKTGDLLYVRNRAGQLAHVVIWVGPIGRSPDGTPLILDSHGEGVRDANGVVIPCGVHLRPFRTDSWYYHSASHAHRLIRGE